MKILHEINDCKKEGEGSATFLLTNKKGSFFSLTPKNNISKFQGLFHFDNDEYNLYKTIENLYLDKEVDKIENRYSYINRLSGESKERFFLTSNALIYEIKKFSGSLTIELDFRYIYDFSNQGRIYKIYKQGSLVIVEYVKFWDSLLINQAHRRYLVIKGLENFEVIDNWVRKDYEYDRKRIDGHEWYVYQAIKARIKDKADIIFVQSKSKKKAIEKIRYVEKRKKRIKQSIKHYSKSILKSKNAALNAAIKSLDDLTVFFNKQKNLTGIWAGLPWFFQFWARDELICLKAYISQQKFGLVKDVLMRYLGQILTDGRLSNRYPPAMLGSADAIGWLFKGFHELTLELKRRRILKDYFTAKELEMILQKLSDSIANIEERYSFEGLITNKSKETWMDTDYGRDDRKGARIEIQALHLSMYSFAHYLCRLLKKRNLDFDKREKRLREKVGKVFFNGKVLADGFYYGIDRTIRPNVFLAYYLYPDLFKKSEWKIIFQSSLEKLWLDWGGLSSIDKNNPLFCDTHTGITNQSYHRGDSWFFINNIAAICMHHLDKKAFADYIQKIKQASENEILWHGFIGHSAELSNAKKLSTAGSPCQAWSAATFIELMSALNR